MKGSTTAPAVCSAEAPGDASVDVEAAADLAASPEMRLWLRKEFGATPPRFDVLSPLNRSPEGLTMGERSKRLMVSNGNVTGIVERQLRDGPVTRAPVAGLPHDEIVQLMGLLGKLKTSAHGGNWGGNWGGDRDGGR